MLADEAAACRVHAGAEPAGRIARGGRLMPRPPAAAPAAPNASLQGISAEALQSLRTDMLRFAWLQLRHDDTAEDLVQEAIEAALRKSASFAGQSSLKTWVFAILRNRIIDHLRQSRRTVTLSSLVDDDDEDWEQRLETLFNERGGWRDGPRPVAWPDPEQSMQTRQFWAVFEACLDHLPPNTGRVFMMREFLGFESDEICSQLGITTSNCHVMLHRARLKLRGCMDGGWGRPEGATC
jgi:RNA polymerase sigma-70 factor (ECF subfamily)